MWEGSAYHGLECEPSPITLQLGRWKGCGMWNVEVEGGWREMVCGWGVFTAYMARSAATSRTCGRFKF